MIYLTSLGCLDIYPENTPCRFVNRLPTPIVLSNDIEYEVGLVSVMYPLQHYIVMPNDENFMITFYTRFQSDGGIGAIHTHTYTPKIGVLAGEPMELVSSLNEDLAQNLKVYLGNNFGKLVRRGRLFRWDHGQKKVVLQYIAGSSFKPGEVSTVHAKFTGKAARVLGFRSDTEYVIYGGRERGDTVGSIPISANYGVDYIHVYTDIVHPSPFADKFTNILDCFHVDNGRNKGVHNTLYKPLSTKILEHISIIITDQRGRVINFTEKSSVTCVLHIRPR